MKPTKNHNLKEPTIGILEWFRIGEYDHVEKTLEDLKTLGISHLRTGISWADWHMDGASDWYDWLFDRLKNQVDLLPCFLYTPPSIAEVPKTSSPPQSLKSYPDFIDVMISRYGDCFEWVELWNEPNNRLEYDFTLDTSWEKFSSMINMAAYWSKHRDKKTLLGGMSPIDPNWLQLMFDKGAMKYIDAIGLHAFPDVFDQQWLGWDYNLEQVKEVLKKNNADKTQIWISETGFSTWQHDEMKQLEEYKKIKSLDKNEVSRVYWYSLYDLDPAQSTIGGFHLDEREYFFGLKKLDGSGKLLYKILEESKSTRRLKHQEYLKKSYYVNHLKPYVMITGGAGFIGTNLAARLVKEGKKVMIYDNLSRPNVLHNLRWLNDNFGDKLLIQIADIKETRTLETSVAGATEIYHLSAQVAVTSSLTDPGHDFEVNLQGTFQLLEAIRKSGNNPPLLFTSTNKVYGNLEDIELIELEKRYVPVNDNLNSGISEQRALDLYSPYGCSKGAADQYILDYSRSFGLQTVVFRMSCIYGPHQFGTEDQGWVAHFLIRCLQGKPITIYGNGKQVRDILFVEDLIEAMCLATGHIDKIAGEVFNMGGGAANMASLIEVLDYASLLVPSLPQIRFEPKRLGDQDYYVSDIGKFNDKTGWKPSYSIHRGMNELYSWLIHHPTPLNLPFSPNGIYKKPTAV